MESNWRYNVAHFGRGASGWQLCASVLGTFDLVYVAKESDTTWGLWRRDIPGFPDELVRFNGPFPIGEGDHFPFGLNVEPD